MPIDPYIAGRVKRIAHLEEHLLDTPEASALLREYARDPEPWTAPPLEIEERQAPGPHGPVPVRVYTPPGRVVGTLVWMHGGAFRGGDLDMAESHVVSAELAHRSGFEVIAVGYRLAVGGVRFPVPLDDVLAAWRWASRPDGGRAIAIGGASAGAALALGAAVSVRDSGGKQPDAVLLAYPAAHFPVPALDFGTASEMRVLPEYMTAPPDAIRSMYTNYVGRSSHVPVLAVPGHADLRGVPPVSIIGCQYDGLRPSAELLRDQLTESDVPVRYLEALGMLHGHLDRTPALARVDESLAFFAEALTLVAERK